MPDQWLTATTGEVFWEKQVEIARALAVNRRVAVASCNAAGKSFLAARLAVWFLTTYSPGIVITTAPTDRQVRRILWKEIHIAYNKALDRGFELGGELLTKEWRFSEEHFALGFSSKHYDATAFQGIHSPHLLIIADEAAGISESIWEGMFSILKGGFTRLLAIGNPTTVDGRFYDAFSSQGWWTTNICAYDTPNFQGAGDIIPELVTPEDVEAAKEDWGEDSPIFTSRILGQFPDTLEDTFIALSLVEQAGAGSWTSEEMLEVDKQEPIHIGADLARYGDDENVFIARRGRLAFDSDSFGASKLGKLGVMTAAGRLVNFTKKVVDDMEAHRDRIVIKCDAIGLGGGVPDRLRELQSAGEIPEHWLIYDMNSGAKAKKPDKFADAGTEWWKGLADKLRGDLAFGPVFKDKKAIGQLSRRKYELLGDGRMKLESKDKMKSRGIKSPDWGDAMAMAYVDSRYHKPSKGMESVGNSYAKNAISW